MCIGPGKKAQCLYFVVFVFVYTGKNENGAISAGSGVTWAEV